MRGGYASPMRKISTAGGAGSGDSAGGTTSSLLDVESDAATVRVYNKALRLEVAFDGDDEFDEDLRDLMRLRKARKRLAGVDTGRTTHTAGGGNFRTVKRHCTH
eukprot:6183476-Pleurochrysis_carterae.AAC.5